MSGKIERTCRERIFANIGDNQRPQSNHVDTMKPIANMLLAVALCTASFPAFAGPSPDYWQRMEAGRKRAPENPAKPEPLCAICAELSKQPNPAAKVVRGRTYDSRQSCRRVLTLTPLPSGKGQAYRSECVCVGPK